MRFETEFYVGLSFGFATFNLMAFLKINWGQSYFVILNYIIVFFLKSPFIELCGFICGRCIFSFLRHINISTKSWISNFLLHFLWC